jgi:hypothetical protein
MSLTANKTLHAILFCLLWSSPDNDEISLRMPPTRTVASVRRLLVCEDSSDLRPPPCDENFALSPTVWMHISLCSAAISSLNLSETSAASFRMRSGRAVDSFCTRSFCPKSRTVSLLWRLASNQMMIWSVAITQDSRVASR